MRYSEKVVTWNAENVALVFSAKRAENQALLCFREEIVSQ